MTSDQMLDAILENAEGMTDWETEFVEDLAERRQKARDGLYGWHYTIKQAEVLERIYDQRVESHTSVRILRRKP